MTVAVFLVVAIVLLVVGIAIGMMMPFLGVLATLFWIWMLVDCIRARFKQKEHKIAWILVIIFTHFLGAIIYFFLIKNKGKN